MDCKYCIDDLDLKIKIADTTKCKYHKKKGQIYPASAIAPKGLCPELFYAAYPACLAVLYNGKPMRGRPRKKGMQETIISCPAPEGVKVRVRSEEVLPRPLKILKEFVEEVCKKLYRGFDAPFRRVTIEVIKTSPNCPKDYKIGQGFQFNIDKKDELCPAGFAAIYPFLRLLSDVNNHKELANSVCVHCPDYVGVTYEVTGDKKKLSMQNFDNICPKYNSLKLKIKYRWKGKKEELSLEDILPGNFCILAFHSVYAYMTTLFTGGWFNWVNHEEHVIVNCPSPEGIGMYVKSPHNNQSVDFQIEVMKNSCNCYKKYKLKDRFDFNFSGDNALKYEMLDKVIPFFGRFSSNDCCLKDFSCMYQGDIIPFQLELGAAYVKGDDLRGMD